MIFFIILVALIVCMLVGFFWGSKREGKIFSGDPTVFDGPAGEPRWNGNLPEKVDDYTEPRYVYENLCESTEYLPQNGRIIGYRISSNLVLHSHCLESINPPRLNKYIKRYGGKLLKGYEVTILAQTWDKVSELRQKAGDSPLPKKEYYWAFIEDVLTPVAVHKWNNCYRDVICISDAFYPLIMKR